MVTKVPEMTMRGRKVPDEGVRAVWKLPKAFTFLQAPQAREADPKKTSTFLSQSRSLYAKVTAALLLLILLSLLIFQTTLSHGVSDGMTSAHTIPLLDSATSFLCQDFGNFLHSWTGRSSQHPKEVPRGSPSEAFLHLLSQELFQAVASNRPISGVNLAKALASFSVEHSTRPEVAYLTYTTEDHLHRTSFTVIMNILHAIIHGYAYILDQEPSPVPLPAGSILYAKVQSFQRHLPQQKSIVWLDTDTIVLDESDLFFRILHEDPLVAPASLILADHSKDINNGVILMRNTSWALAFLDKWWEKSQYGYFEWYDQCSMYLAMVDELERNVSPVSPQDCPRPMECEAEKPSREFGTHKCLARHFLCRGFDYDNRTRLGNMAVLPQNKNEYRINQWFFGGRSIEQEWNPECFYRPGDLVVHTKFPMELLTPDSLLFRRRVSLAMDVVLGHQPDLWHVVNLTDFNSFAN